MRHTLSMDEPGTSGLVVGNVEAHPLVHLRVAGGDETLCRRPAGVDWPTKTFRTAGCLTCLDHALELGHTMALDSDGSWLSLDLPPG